MEKTFSIPKNEEMWRIAQKSRAIVREWTAAEMTVDYQQVLGTCILAHQTRHFNPRRTDNPYEVALIVVREKIELEQYNYAFRTSLNEQEKSGGVRASYSGDICMTNLKDRVVRSGCDFDEEVEEPKPKIDRPCHAGLVSRDLSLSSDTDSQTVSDN